MKLTLEQVRMKLPPKQIHMKLTLEQIRMKLTPPKQIHMKLTLEELKAIARLSGTIEGHNKISRRNEVICEANCINLKNDMNTVLKLFECEHLFVK